MKDENMLKKKDFDDAAVVAALRRGHRRRLYFEQIAVFRHKFMNYSGYSLNRPKGSINPGNSMLWNLRLYFYTGH